ncbi:MAG: nucleotidyl transferase AbiEii/AbiGii toxin family protein [Kofleriaceae bacterium]|nr:MAG: nucleotidyl transferase AbiEii/AbiGii toxin family protein [Kofleriaceae bacterium]MBZ0231684.1 nucleotidyl transferase AbiEii/AbiGii toxin family protein [Kofleriaceae bacterium]
MPGDVSDALADLARAFAAAHVRWYVFGAQAVAAAGVPRFTADIDVTVELPRTGVRELLSVLASHGFAMRDVGDVTTFIAETRVVPVDHVASQMPVDIVLAGPGLEEEMLQRVRVHRIGGRQIPFIDTADLVALKMLAGRPKDLEDVRGLVRARPASLSLEVARSRVGDLAAMVDDSTLLTTLDRIIREESAEPRPGRAPSAPRKPAPKPVKKATGRRGRASRRPRRR